MNLRLNKVLARSGSASRRGADQLIRDGRVSVNGEIVRTLGVRVDPARDTIRVDGRRIRPAPVVNTYMMLNKPRGYLTTVADPLGRPTIIDLVDRPSARIYPVGRLDFDSEGLLLLTDDGDLARDLMHPRSAVPKTYVVKIRGMPDAAEVDRLRTGMILDGRATRPARVRLMRTTERHAWVEITVTEGRNRQVRRMFDAVGHPVLKLRRTSYAGLRLGSLLVGKARRLTAREVAGLRRAAGSGRPAKPSPRKAPARRN